jgi:branched-chain amino acid transport system ATP-binding protein
MSGAAPALRLEGLAAGYGGTQILHGIDLDLAAGETVCLVGPNGAGKSTVLNAAFGFADILHGGVYAAGRDVTRLSPHAKLREAGIAYVLQDSSVFPDLSVEDNLRLGAHLESRADARIAVERVFSHYPRLAERSRQPARVLSGGERRLLEIARALMMTPRVLLLDEPSLGLEPRHIDAVFDALHEIRGREGVSMLLVEQNAAKGLAFADTGCLMVAGRIAMTGPGDALARDPALGRLFLGDA